MAFAKRLFRCLLIEIRFADVFFLLPFVHIFEEETCLNNINCLIR